VTQIDLPSGKRSGLLEAVDVLTPVEGIAFVYFNERDVVRHNLVQRIIRAYERYHQMDLELVGRTTATESENRLRNRAGRASGV
jgi:phosphate starvation-inducible PhoH-like protein